MCFRTALIASGLLMVLRKRCSRALALASSALVLGWDVLIYWEPQQSIEPLRWDALASKMLVALPVCVGAGMLVERVRAARSVE